MSKYPLLYPFRYACVSHPGCPRIATHGVGLSSMVCLVCGSADGLEGEEHGFKQM